MLCDLSWHKAKVKVGISGCGLSRAWGQGNFLQANKARHISKTSPPGEPAVGGKSHAELP